MEAVVEPGNLKKALARVRRNKGAPGVDGMTVDELGDHLKAHWPEIRSRLLAGSYSPQPVRRVAIPEAVGWRFGPDARPIRRSGARRSTSSRASTSSSTSTWRSSSESPQTRVVQGDPPPAAVDGYLRPEPCANVDDPA